MADTPERLAERLRSEGQKTEQFFRELTSSQWEIKVYSEGTQWVVRQVISHFLASEVSFTKLMENILAGGPGSPEDFDLDRYNERQVAKLREVPVDDLLKRFIEQRQKNADLVAHMQAADLERTGRHPFLGVAPMKAIIKMIYRHNQIHQREMRKVIG